MVAAVVLFAVALMAASVATPTYPTRDGLAYMELGRSLARGEGYQLLGLREHLWPPGLPLMLAALFATGVECAGLARAMLAAWALAGGWLTYRLALALDVRAPAGHRVGPRLAGFVALGALLNPAVLRLERSVLSEAPFATLVLAALLCWSRWLQSGGHDARWPVLGALAAAAAVMVRSAGVFVGPALVLATLLSRAQGGECPRPSLGPGGEPRPRGGRRGSGALGRSILAAALWGAGTATGVAAATAIVGGRAGASGYLRLAARPDPYGVLGGPLTPGRFLGRAAVAGVNWWLYAGAALLGQKAPEAGVVVGPLLLAAVGAALAGRRRRALAGVTCVILLYGAGVALTGFEQGVRFAVPMVPVFWLLLTALLPPTSGPPGRARRLLGHAAAIALILTALSGAATILYDAARLRWGADRDRVRGGYELNPGQLEELTLLERWIPPQAPTLSDNALLLRRLTGRPLFPTVPMPDPGAMEAQLERWGIRYACVTRTWMAGDRPRFAARPWPRIADGQYLVVLQRPR